MLGGNSDVYRAFARPLENHGHNFTEILSSDWYNFSNSAQMSDQVAAFRNYTEFV